MTTTVYYKEKGWDYIRQRSTSYEVFDEKGNFLTETVRALTINWEACFEIACDLVDKGIKGHFKIKKYESN